MNAFRSSPSLGPTRGGSRRPDYSAMRPIAPKHGCLRHQNQRARPERPNGQAQTRSPSEMPSARRLPRTLGSWSHRLGAVPRRASRRKPATRASVPDLRMILADIQSELPARPRTGPPPRPVVSVVDEILSRREPRHIREVDDHPVAQRIRTTDIRRHDVAACTDVLAIHPHRVDTSKHSCRSGASRHAGDTFSASPQRLTSGASLARCRARVRVRGSSPTQRSEKFWAPWRARGRVEGTRGAPACEMACAFP